MTIELHWASSPKKKHLRRADFRISTDSGREITGALWIPDNHSQTTLSCFGHGASGDRFQWPIPDLAARASIEANTISLSMDGPFHGLRQPEEGNPRQLFVQGLVEGSVIDDMSSDWKLAIAAISSEFNLRVERTTYFGLSMGTILGLPFLAAHDSVCAVVLGLAGTSDRIPGSKRLTEAAGNLAASVLFLMNLQDETFSREASLNLFDSIASEEKRLHANAGPHNLLPEDEITLIGDFLRDHLMSNDKRGYRSIINGEVI